MKPASCVVALFGITILPLLSHAAAGRGGPNATPATVAPRMSSVRVGSPADVAGSRREMLQLHDRLVADQVELGVRNSIRVEVGSDALRRLGDGVNERRLRVGVVAPVGADIGFAAAALDVNPKQATLLPHGAVQRIDGRMVWSTAVQAHGAAGIRLKITGLQLPADTELAVFNDRGEAFSYTGRGPLDSGEFWTNTVTGSTAYLQVTGSDLSGVAFTISDLGYLGDRFVFGADSGTEKSFCSYNEPCIENAGCGIDPPASAATDAVAHMQFVSGAFLYVCSGGLLNNDAGRPYFLTANHCISKNNEASSLEAYFAYEIGCNGSCPAQWSKPSTPRTVGASIVASDRTSDYTLLELAQPAPAGTVLLGWNATDIALDNGVDLYRISHPAGAPQAYSTHQVDTSYGTCRSWPRGNWIYSRDLYGATEGGSSGSPVVNGSGEVVGQLSGGCGTNVNDACDSVNNATVDGAFAAYYSGIAGFLGAGATCDPAETCGDGVDNDCNGLIDDGCDTGGGCTDADADGWCVSDGDCDDSNPNVYPGHNDTRGRWGRDGVDNDCNGVIDG